MDASRFIYRNTIFLFAAIPLLAFLVFGAAFYLRMAGGHRGYLPLETLHAITTGLWCLLLPAQAYLIRTHRFDAHRALGRTSFVLAPLVVLSILWISHDVLRFFEISQGSLYILAIRAFLIVYFAGFYCLAISQRHRPDVHARWMICSALILLDPMLSRISAFVHPVSFTTGFHQWVSFGVMDTLVALLAIYDWRGARKDVFLPALALMIVGQVLALTLWDTEAWRVIAQWFLLLPLPAMA